MSSRWVEVKNAKRIECHACGKYHVVSVCHDQTTGANYRFVHDEKLRRALFFAALDAISFTPIALIPQSIYLALRIITFADFFNSKNTNFIAAKNWGQSVLRLILSPAILLAMLITGLLGTITPFKDGPKNARKLYSAFEYFLFQSNGQHSLRPIRTINIIESDANEKSQDKQSAATNLFNLRFMFKHLQPINEWQHIHAIVELKCNNCGGDFEEYKLHKIRDNSTNGLYLAEPTIVTRFKLFNLIIATPTLNAFFYIAHSAYRLLKLVTLYEFRNPENTWSDACSTTAIDLTRIATGPVILAGMQVTALLGTITPMTDGPKDARKMYALGETLLYGYDEFRVANCFKPTYPIVTIKENSAMASPAPS